LIRHSKNKKVNYHGIDIFLEGWSKEIELKEVSIPPHSKDAVMNYLKNITSGEQEYSVNLHQGLSSEMLPKLNDSDIKFDLVWIDGGHSYETIKLDLEYSLKMLSEGGIIFFDDYTTERSYPADNPTPLAVKAFIDDLIKEDKYDIKILNNYVDDYRGHHYKIVSLQKRK
jgi:predicted O-methyltransferase YrrM